MKRIITILILAMGSTLFMQGQPIQRTILIEEFTNASCGPCAAQNPDFNILLDANTDIAIPLKFQVWWPGYDPMYEQNSDQIDVRTPYYGISGVPTAVLNGRIPDNSNTTGGNWTGYAGGPYGYTQAVLDNEAMLTSPFEVKVSHSIYSDLDSIEIHCVIKNVDTTAFSASSNSLVAHIAVTEDMIDFPSPPGTTNQEDFPEVVRRMLPNINGTALPQNWAPGDSVVIDLKVELPDYIYSYGEVSVVAFVQNSSSKEVWQAGKSEANPTLANQFPDAVVANNMSVDGYCNSTIEPKITLENGGQVAITSAELHATMEGGTVLNKSWSGNLAPGESEDITFSSGNLVFGGNNISFSISSVNGVRDVSRMNNDYDNGSYVIRIPDNEIDPTPKTLGFEGTSLGDIPENTYEYNPDNARMYVVDQGVSSTVNWPLGGFGNSQSCLRFDFYAISPGVSASLILEKIDFSDVVESYMKFSYSYRQYSNQNDRLLIEASTDCGETWTTIFDKAGDNLKTGDPVSTGRFYPEPTDWVSDSVDISQLDGAGEVVIRITGISDFGNSLYLDDFEFSGRIVSGINDPNTMEMAVFPNPAQNVLYIDLEEKAIGPWNMIIYNALGQEVNSGIVQLGSSTAINVSALPSGYYVIGLNNGEKSIQKRFVIER